MGSRFRGAHFGPTALVNLSRKKDGSANVAQLVGDYRNPILKPEAAERVAMLGEEFKKPFWLSRSSQPVLAEVKCPSFWQATECKSSTGAII